MAYQTQLDRVAARLTAVPGRFSEASISRLGALNHFETFDDVVDGKRRQSLSGSIVVLDIDIEEGVAHSVNVSLASDTQGDTLSYLKPEHNPNGCILRSLHQPRLNQFTKILEFLSRCDRYSTKDIDCFVALDLVGKAVEAKSLENPLYGKVEVNPDCMGIALKYHKENLAYLDVTEGNSREYALLQTTWLDESGQWVVPPACTFDVRAQLVLRLDPPVIVPQYLAQEWSAASEPADSSLLNNRRIRSSAQVMRHPKYRGVELSDTFDATIVNLLPFEFVAIKEIPLKHPQEIPGIVNRLRQYQYLDELAASLNRSAPIFPSNDLDISIADVVAFKNKPTATQLICVDITFTQDQQDVKVVMSIPQANSSMTVELPAASTFDVNINGAVNIPDLTKLVAAGNLALCCSYIVGSLGMKHHRLSVSVN